MCLQEPVDLCAGHGHTFPHVHCWYFAMHIGICNNNYSRICATNALCQNIQKDIIQRRPHGRCVLHNWHSQLPLIKFGHDYENQLTYLAGGIFKSNNRKRPRLAVSSLSKVIFELSQRPEKTTSQCSAVICLNTLADIGKTSMTLPTPVPMLDTPIEHHWQNPCTSPWHHCWLHSCPWCAQCHCL